MKQLFSSATVMWEEHEILLRDSLVSIIPNLLYGAWQKLNPAVRMMRVETPVLTPASELQSHIAEGFDLIGPVGNGGSRGYLRPETTAGTMAALNLLYPPDHHGPHSTQGKMKRPPRRRLYHKASLINERGDVSALCFARPHKIDITKLVTWTTDWKAVTCKKCLAFQEREVDVKAAQRARQ